MVPTPFLIGVCDSFMKKVRDYQVAETWVINLDSKKVRPYSKRRGVNNYTELEEEKCL